MHDLIKIIVEKENCYLLSATELNIGCNFFFFKYSAFYFLIFIIF